MNLPSAITLDKKKSQVDELAAKISASCAGVLVDYKGINVADDTKLRKEFRDAGVQYAVIKNSMLRFALKKAGYDGFDGSLEGTTALALSENDPICAAKIAADYSKKIKKGFELKAGFMDGQTLDAAKVTELGNLPSKEQLVGQLLSVLTANVRGLAVALNAIAEKDPA